MLSWTGKPWGEQEREQRPAGWGGNLDDNLAPFRPKDPLTGRNWKPDPALYRVVGRAGVERLKPRRQRPTVAGVLGIVYLTVVAGLLAGGVIFWCRMLQIWLR